MFLPSTPIPWKRWPLTFGSCIGVSLLMTEFVGRIQAGDCGLKRAKQNLSLVCHFHLDISVADGDMGE